MKKYTYTTDDIPDNDDPKYLKAQKQFEISVIIFVTICIATFVYECIIGKVGCGI